MHDSLIISTGGTFNKVYNPLTGMLDIDASSSALSVIAAKWGCDFEILNIIGKDSLEMTNHDRLELMATINRSAHQNIVIVHGTDTMDITAAYLAEGELQKRIILTGAMVPYSIDATEATANLCCALGYLQNIQKDGVYIAMNGLIDSYEKVKKDRNKGKFILAS